MRRDHLSLLALQLATAGVYFVGAKAGLALASLVPQITLVWPPTGIALAAVVLLGLRVWPGIALGAFAANITTAEPFLTAACIAVGNTLEAVVGGHLLARFDFRPRLGRLRDAAALVVLAAGLSTTISASIGVASLCAGGLQPWSQYWRLWQIWWLGDACGDLMVAPLLLSWSVRPWRRWSPRQRVELALLWGVAAVVAAAVFSPRLDAVAREVPLVYLAFPVVIVTALRHGSPGATLAVATTMGFALGGTLLGTGPFARPTSTESLVLLQLYTSVLALTGLVLGALALERQRYDRQRAAMHAAVSLLSEPAPLAEVGSKLLHAVCDKLEWDVGGLWAVDGSTHVLRCIGAWWRPGSGTADFVVVSRSLTFAPGVGLPGRVWAAGEPAWIPDVVRDLNFPRAAIAERVGLHAGFGFPIGIEERVEGVIEFFSRDIEEPDAALLEVVRSLGVQLAQFLDRSRAELALHQSQRELAERVAELAEAGRRKDEFLATLAHELRNPLSPIAAATEILADADSSAASTKRAREILSRQVQHMIRLIDDLLDVSRLDRGKVRLDRSDVTLTAVVEHALEVSRGWIETRHQRLELALPTQPVVLYADRIRLAQVLANLLNNAAKFTPPGGTIGLEAGVEGDAIQIRVRDDGVGIEPELLPHIFEPFFQSATAMDRSHGGLGIGLTLVRSLVEMHEGEVSARSEGSGRGSEFVVRLPLRRSDSAPEPLVAAPAARAAQSLRILLVEDNEDAAQSLAHLLRLRGHEMHVARSGPEGLARALELRPDAVLLDIALPGLDGFEVARRLREQTAGDGPLLVAVSGYGRAADRERAMAAGFDHHLVKPVRLAELGRILGNRPARHGAP